MRARALPVAALALALAAACTDSTQPAWVAEVRVQPDSIHLEPGESATFTAVPLGPKGEELPDRAERIEWTVEKPALVSLSGDGPAVTVTAEGLGTSALVAELARGSERVLVHVQPPGLDRIEIDPPSVRVPDGTRLTLRARLLDQSGTELDPNGFRISWEVGDPDIAYTLQNETGPSFTTFARAPGRTQIKLIVGPLSTSIDFEVLPR